MTSPLEALVPGSPRKRLALVLSGGGNLGVVQVPFLQALIDLGVRPDLIVGASVGSLNGAFLAFHPDNLHGLAELWLSLRDRRLWSRNVLEIGHSLLLKRMSLYSNDFLRGLIEPHVTIDEISASQIPLFITATNLTSGRKHIFSSGPVIDSILASSAVPGLFPPVRIRGEWFVDGIVATGLDLDTAISQGATEIIAVDLGAPPSPHRPKWMGDVIARCWEIAVERRTERELDHLAPEVPTVVLRPGLSAHRSASFEDVEELYEAAQGMAPHMIERARRPDGRWIPGVYEGAVPVGTA